ncbi:MAG TPA: penicillin-binding transpeptidase domain-containing protein [Solirubrobacteraceae bacterium]|nr:penicillin-binding transpeptidase domain-containing protein [Solirubrobacteraceae bacterium]
MSAIEPVRRRDPPIPVSPQLALRVAIISGVVMVLFGVIFFRLWFLQVLSNEQYVSQADANHARELPIAAPRGAILDRNGQTLVGSTVSNAVQIVPSELPPGIGEQLAAYEERLSSAEKPYRAALARLRSYDRSLRGVAKPSSAQRAELDRLRADARAPRVPMPALPRSALALRRLFTRLGRVLRLSARTIDERVVEGMITTPYAHVTVKTDAGPGALTILGERADEYPGVVQEPVAIREYPHGEMAAQILGYVGQVNTEELERPAFRGVKQGTIVGQAGLEYYYDHYLRGVPGKQRIPVDAEGQPVPGQQLAPIPPRAGRSLQTTLDLPLQLASESALLEGIEHARAGGKPAIAGAFVALDPLSGEVLAMGSSPSFDPNKFAKPLTYAELGALTGRNGDEPGRLTDLADEGEFPTGSTFKPITAMAALEAGVIDPQEGLGAGQCIYVSSEPFCNAGMAEYGAADLVDALKVSSDTYFFTVGKLAQEHGGDIIQKKAHELGIGEETGIDLPHEFPGVVPDAKWLAEQDALEAKCARAHHGHPCYIVAEPGAPWTVGYNMDLAVGQGELLTDPLQMAVAYSALATAYRNGGEGTVVTPHLGKQIDEGDKLVQTLRFPSRHVHLDYEDLSDVMEGIHDAASEQGGTSAEVWSGWDQGEDPVYGKTGTAERAGHVEQSWYMCYIGNAQHPIVIAVTVEEGGFGAETAAPIARLIASQWYGKSKKFIAGNSKTF